MEKNEIYDIDRVIWFQIKRLTYTANLDGDELFQIAYAGYLDARKNYKEEYGQMTLSYAVSYIKHNLHAAIKKQNKINTMEIPPGPLTELPCSTQHEYEDRILDRKKVFKRAKNLLHILNPKERDVVKSCYFNSDVETLRNIGKRYNISTQRVHQIKKRALEKLKEALYEEGYL